MKKRPIEKDIMECPICFEVAVFGDELNTLPSMQKFTRSAWMPSSIRSATSSRTAQSAASFFYSACSYPRSYLVAQNALHLFDSNHGTTRRLEADFRCCYPLLAPRNMRAAAVALADAVRGARALPCAHAAAAVASRIGGGHNVRRLLYDTLKILAAVGVVVRTGGTLRWAGTAHLRPVLARVASKRAAVAALASRIGLPLRDTLQLAPAGGCVLQCPKASIEVSM